MREVGGNIAIQELAKPGAKQNNITGENDEYIVVV